MQGGLCPSIWLGLRVETLLPDNRLVTRPVALIQRSRSGRNLSIGPILSGRSAALSQTHRGDGVLAAGEADVQVMVVKAVPAIALSVVS